MNKYNTPNKGDYMLNWIKKMALVLTLACGISIIVIGCNKQDSAVPTPAPAPVVVPAVVAPSPTVLHLDVTADGVTQNISVGSEVVVTLVEDTTQSLKWVLASNEGNVVMLTNEDKKTPKPTAEIRQFTFKVEKAGVANLSFAYGPYTQEKAKAEQTVSFTIIAK
jgi:predicted secreted protein